MNESNTRPQRALIESPTRAPAEPPADTYYRIEAEPGLVNFHQLLGAIRRNVWVVLVLTALSLGAAAFFVSRETTQYSASSIIRLLDGNQDVVIPASSKDSRTVDPVESEMMVLTGRNVLGKVVDREGLRLFDASTSMPASFVSDVEILLEDDESGVVRLEFGDSEIRYGPDSDRRSVPYGAPIVFEGARFVVSEAPTRGRVVLHIVPRDLAIDYVSSALSRSASRMTAGIEVTFVSENPELPVRAVNSIVQTYQAVNAESARQEMVRQRLFLEEQLKITDSLLMLAQSGLSGFRAEEQAYSASGRFSAEQGNLVQVEIQQAQLQADLRMHENVLNQILEARAAGSGNDLSSMMSIPGIASDPIVGSLYSQLVGQRTEREGLVTGAWAFAPTHPDVRRLDILIAFTEDRLIDAVRSHIASLRAQIDVLGSLRGRSLAKMNELPRTEVEEMYLTQNVTALQQTATQLRDQYQAVRLEEAAEGGRVEIVELATYAYPLPVSRWTKLLIGLITGLLLGGAVALIREKMDHSINRPEDIEELLLIPNLAVIPAATPHLLGANGNGIGSPGAPDPPGTEAYRVLRTNLLFSQGRLRTLVVTSAAPGEGKTMTAVNLSAAIARQGRRVLLMECDLRRPSLMRFFKSTDAGADLTDVLLDNRAWTEAIQPSGVPGLDLLLASQSVPRAAEYLAGTDMKKLLDQLSAQYDMVILDTSPLLVGADAAFLGAIVDGVLLVVRATHTEREAVQQAMHHLSLVGARVVGTVLNDPDGSSARYGTYYDYSAEYEVT